MKMKKSNNHKDVVTGFGSQGYERIELNSTGSDDDIAIDIQDAISRDVSLSLVSDNIHVRVEGEIVTLEGEVDREEEKITAGDIATSCVGYDKVNNYLGVIHTEKSKNRTRRVPW
jgi:osmotically-inducible protein OsmY